MAAPAWQTDELGEEWVETSPSPPSSPTQQTSTINNASSLNAKRGSLRSLGQGAARALPPSRKNSLGPDYARSPSNPLIRNVSGMLSPPTSVSGASSSGDEDRAATAAAGTFQIKDGEDSHGKAFPKSNPFGQGKDMFSALALERMFEPPSPPVQTSSAPTSPPAADKTGDTIAADISTSPRSVSAPTKTSTPTSAPFAGLDRRVSHPYAPTCPSRLSKSMTPMDASFGTVTESEQRSTLLPLDHSGVDDEQPNLLHLGDNLETQSDFDHSDLLRSPSPSDSRSKSRTRTQSRSPSPTPRGPTPVESPTRSPTGHSFGTTREISTQSLLKESEDAEQGEEDDRQPSLDKDGFAFTFTSPVRRESGISRPSFSPDFSPLKNGEPSHSTLRSKESKGYPGGLRLFRNTYDTYTREHLSALVDSIAIRPSPSPPSMPNAKDLRDWSPEATRSPVMSGSSSESRSLSMTPDSGTSLSDERSSKRLRLSPVSPRPRGPAAVRDWKAQGAALMNRIRVSEPDYSSVTSDSRSSRSRSETPSTAAERTESGIGGPTVDYDAIPNIPTPAESEAEDARGTMRSTKSSQRVVNRGSMRSETSKNVGSVGSDGKWRSNPSTTSSTYLHRAEDMMARIKSRKVSDSTSTNVVSPEMGPEKSLSTNSYSSEAESHIPRWRSPDDDRSSNQDGARSSSRTSRTSVEGAGRPPNVNRDDLNRFISSSTLATATTASTSFVKHAGPRDPSKMRAGMTMIQPGDVQNLMSDRIGKMRYDPASMRWIRDTNDSLGRVDEAGESRLGASDDSADPFAGIDSVNSVSPQTRITAAFATLADEPVADQDRVSERSKSESESEADEAAQDEHDDADKTPMAIERPILGQSVSAPVLKTPNVANAGTPNGGLRSALRNPNATPASAMKKRTAWHADVTPRPASESPSMKQRSVSFSDGVMIAEHLHYEEYTEYEEQPTERSWMPSARTKRIQGVLDNMAELTIEDGSPSKARPPRSLSPKRPSTSQNPAVVVDLVDTTADDSEDTVPLPTRSFRSFRSRGGRGDQTFLTECSFGVAHDRLVQLITDVQPFEPYWEQLRTIDLSHKGIDSLARLKEFLPALDEARLNNNAIEYLSGIPSTVRTLHASFNRLTSLTSVNHLRNLQYLDISHNQLDGVSQLKCLSHLRELNCSHNGITDLSGILDMDCLIKLNASSNQIKRVDLEGCKWQRLETLDLSNNHIHSVHGLNTLRSLTSLNLDHNSLHNLEPPAPMTSVRVLRLSDNELNYLDLSFFPRVRTLFADNNAIPGLSRSSTGGHRIENLSLRNQRVQRFFLSPEDLQSVKRLYVSGNKLDADFIPLPVFSLVYLEAAACGLTSWPTDFASRVPNLHILNINYNFLSDLDGLAGLVRLRKLMAVGNRLGSQRYADGLQSAPLEELDLRMNPATLSFYLPIMLPKTKAKNGKRDADGTMTSVASLEADDAAVPANWAALDNQFRKHLPDEWYSKRLVYRGLLMASCPDLRTLDGVVISSGERRKAALLLEYVAAAGAR